jgi:pimeloyl-ACP methyl ester carboxylesterase
MAELRGRCEVGIMTYPTPSQKLAHRQIGTGPDLVFIHGWPLHGETFRHIIPHLADRFTCHVFDMPGAGRSVWDASTSISIEAHAAAVVAAIDELGLGPVGLLAHDSGATIARLVAARLERRCFGLVLGNTEIPGYHPPRLKRLMRRMQRPGGKLLLRLALAWRWLRRSNASMGAGFVDRSLIDGEFGRLFIDPLLASKRAFEGLFGLVRSFDWRVHDDMVHTHARITAPVRLVWGAGDRWFPLALARCMLPQFSGGADLVELPGKTFVHEELPAPWAAFAREHLLKCLDVAKASISKSHTAVSSARDSAS